MSFDFSDELKASVKHANELLRQAAEDFALEQRELDEAWDKRVKEVAELERIFSL